MCLITGAQISVFKAPSLSTGTAVPLTGTETVQERPLLLWEGETRLPDCGVINQVGIDHLSRLTAPLIASTRAGNSEPYWLLQSM